VDQRRARTLFRRQVLVARAHRQAIGFAQRLARQQFDREREVADHVPDHRELLVILAPEPRDVRLHLVEQARDHGGHAIEVPGRCAPSSTSVTPGTRMCTAPFAP
jgi:hypothetical protein